MENKTAQNKMNIDLNRLWMWSALFLLVMVGFSLWAWTRVPAGVQVPIHWNAAGEPDNYGSKFVGIFLMPLVALGVILIFSLIRFIDPLRANIARSGTAFRATLLGVLFFMTAIHGAAMAYIAGYPLNIGYIAAPAVGLLFIIMGNYLGKIRRNYMFGVRTPWTLASDLSWNKTHRFAGKLFVVTGLLILFVSFWNPAWAFYTMIGAIVITLVLTMIYSYQVWKNDPAMREHGAAG